MISCLRKIKFNFTQVINFFHENFTFKNFKSFIQEDLIDNLITKDDHLDE
jgi:hypothetical protein